MSEIKEFLDLVKKGPRKKNWPKLNRKWALRKGKPSKNTDGWLEAYDSSGEQIQAATVIKGFQQPFYAGLHAVDDISQIQFVLGTWPIEEVPQEWKDKYKQLSWETGNPIEDGKDPQKTMEELIQEYALFEGGDWVHEFTLEVAKEIPGLILFKDAIMVRLLEIFETPEAISEQHNVKIESVESWIQGVRKKGFIK